MAKRGRKPGPDEHKLGLILEALLMNPNGLWVREISRITSLDKSTVSIYLNTHLKEELHTIHHKPMKMVKLKKKEKAIRPDYFG